MSGLEIWNGLPAKKVEDLAGWGNHPKAPASLVRPERMRQLAPGPGPQIARGLGRSYGDASLCTDGAVILTQRLNRLLEWDAELGRVRAEAGATLEDLLEVFVPRGWFLPVTPGTKFCSLGGCLASDVHGKNHHEAGTFSRHVTQVKMADGLGSRRILTAEGSPDLFWATAGGMGLTGIICDLELQLQPIETSYIKVRHRRGSGLLALMEMLNDPALDAPYSVAWIDCVATGDKMGRGILMTGSHAAKLDLPLKLAANPLVIHKLKGKPFPIDLPTWALNPRTVGAFNGFYDWMQGRKTEFLSHYDQFFYPLDGIRGWNRMYGKPGFIQYQFVLPLESSAAGMELVLRKISEAGRASFLAVLKKFGAQGQGHLSFPFPGFTLSLDIPVRDGLPEFVKELDAIVMDHGGRHYMAKDSTCTPEMIAASYPRLAEWKQARDAADPEGRFASDLSRRLGLTS